MKESNPNKKSGGIKLRTLLETQKQISNNGTNKRHRKHPEQLSFPLPVPGDNPPGNKIIQFNLPRSFSKSGLKLGPSG
jgi:hypothetical protein